jgi:hypothetical protein
MLSNAFQVDTLLRDADGISQLSWWLGQCLYVSIRTPRGTGMGCNDLTSPVLQLRKYQTRQLQILVCSCWTRHVQTRIWTLRVLAVLLLCDRALPLAASLFWGVTFNHVSFEQIKQQQPGWNFDGLACGLCKNRPREQVMRARRA